MPQNQRNIQVLLEDVVTFRHGLKLTPPVKAQTIKNWAHNGLLNRHTGKQVFLEWAHQGKTPVTSKQAIYRFQQALNSE